MRNSRLRLLFVIFSLTFAFLNFGVHPITPIEANNSIIAENEDDYYSQQSEQRIFTSTGTDIKTVTLRLGNKEVVIQRDDTNGKDSILVIGYSRRTLQAIRLKAKDFGMLASLKQSHSTEVAEQATIDALDLMSNWPSNVPVFVYMDRDNVISMAESCKILYQPRENLETTNNNILRLLSNNSNAQVQLRKAPETTQAISVETKDSHKKVELHVNDKRIFFERDYAERPEGMRVFAYSLFTNEITTLSEDDYALLKQITLGIDLKETDQLVIDVLGILNNWPNNLPVFTIMNHTKILSVPDACRPEYRDRSNSDSPVEGEFLQDNSDIRLQAFTSLCSSVRSTRTGRILVSRNPDRYESFSHLVGNARGDYSTGGCFGRCGIGCDTTGTLFDKYTQDCFNHDGCVGRFGYTDSRCNRMFVDTVDDAVNATICPAIIDSFSPTSGREGTRVQISGLNLSSVYRVTFNNTRGSYDNFSSVRFRATVPRRATTGPITVTTWPGSRTTSSNFTVRP